MYYGIESFSQTHQAELKKMERMVRIFIADRMDEIENNQQLHEKIDFVVKALVRDTHLFPNVDYYTSSIVRVTVFNSFKFPVTY